MMSVIGSSREGFQSLEDFRCERIHAGIDSPELSAGGLFSERRDLVAVECDRTVVGRLRPFDNYQRGRGVGMGRAHGLDGS